jgi:hypothetical protein
METIMSEPLRCTAKSKTTGKQCKNLPIVGGTVCVSHGGSIPAVKAAAQRKMIALIDPALAVLYRAMFECDEWPSKIRAALGVLDRAGMGVASTLTLDTEKTDLSQLSMAELRERARVVTQRFTDLDETLLIEPPDEDDEGSVH